MTQKSTLSNKKGITLLETIAAVMITSMLGLMLGSITVTTAKAYSIVSAESNMQTEAIIMSRKLLSEVGDFGPKDVSSCGENCIIFSERPTISFDSDNNPIVVEGTDTLTVKIEENDLYVGTQSLVSSVYSIKELSSDEGLSYKCTSSGCTDAIITLKITLVNDKKGIEYQFTTSFPI